jgi:DNA-binding CsgD family transcriptional regulator
MDFLNLENEISMTTEEIKSNYAFSLTKREAEIMRLVAKGCTNKQIAAKLFISEETVKKHLKNIFCKLNVGNRVSAVMKLRS